MEKLRSKHEVAKIQVNGKLPKFLNRCKLLQLSWFGAQKFCRRLGLVLGSLDTRQKIEQFQNLLRSTSDKKIIGHTILIHTASLF
jgi:hypothetical protein